MAVEVLRELWRIVETRDGAVYRTSYVEDRWVPMELADKAPEGFMYVSKSTDYDGALIRRVVTTEK